MRTLNRAAAEVLVAHGVAAATDVTGFGLLGHGLEMARSSGTRLRLRCGGAAGARRRARPGDGRCRDRRRGAQPAVRPPALIVADGVAPELVTLAHDPQTSGGLLAAIDPERIDAVEADLDGRGVPHWRIGRVEAGDPAVVLGSAGA